MKQATGTALLWLFLCVQLLHAQSRPPTLKKFAPEVLKEDLSLLQKILEANHPSLYWYAPKDSMDAYFQNTINGITDSLNELQFRNRTAWVISKIRCGHTSVRFSKKYERRAGDFRYPQFPLVLKAWADSLVVLGNLNLRDSLFTRGTIITSINGRTNRQLFDTLFPFMVSDGYSLTHKYQVLSGNFPAWYKTIIGLDSINHIGYMGADGREKTAELKNFSPSEKSAGKPDISFSLAENSPTRKQIREAKRLAERSLVIDTAQQTAIMRLSSFNGSLRGFFRRSFRTLKKKKVPSLVIDLRENGGGRVRNSILLARYLSDHSFRIGDSVVATSRKFRYGKYIKPVLPYWLAMNLGANKMEDGLIHYRYYETNNFEPKQRNHYSGELYLLQGGYTFSAASMFVSYLKGQKNVTLVGEETGGGNYGSSAMHIPTITLPHTGLRVTLPMYRVVMDANREKGHGVMPDVAVGPSSQAIKRGIDPKMEKIRELIQQKAAAKNHW